MTIQFNATLIRKPIAEKSDNWQEGSFEWRVSINNAIFSFYTGSALGSEPTLDDVLYSLISDSQACEMSFDEWCSDFGYNTDSRKALETYLLCQSNTKKLVKAGIDISKERERLQDY